MHRFNFSAKTSNKHIVLNCKYQLCLEKETSFQIVRIASKTTKAANRFIPLFKFDLNCYCFLQSIFLSDSLARALTWSPIHFLALSFTSVTHSISPSLIRFYDFGHYLHEMESALERN